MLFGREFFSLYQIIYQSHSLILTYTTWKTSSKSYSYVFVQLYTESSKPGSNQGVLQQVNGKFNEILLSAKKITQWSSHEKMWGMKEGNAY